MESQHVFDDQHIQSVCKLGDEQPGGRDRNISDGTQAIYGESII